MHPFIGRAHMYTQTAGFTYTYAFWVTSPGPIKPQADTLYRFYISTRTCTIPHYNHIFQSQTVHDKVGGWQVYTSTWINLQTDIMQLCTLRTLPIYLFHSCWQNQSWNWSLTVLSLAWNVTLAKYTYMANTIKWCIYVLADRSVLRYSMKIYSTGNCNARSVNGHQDVQLNIRMVMVVNKQISLFGDGRQMA